MEEQEEELLHQTELMEPVFCEWSCSDLLLPAEGAADGNDVFIRMLISKCFSHKCACCLYF